VIDVDATLVAAFSETEVATPVGAPDTTAWAGRRTKLLLVAAQTGLRISELIALTWADAVFGANAHVARRAMGRKDRARCLSG